MKNFSDEIKDFLYDAVDYILIIVIILATVGIIGWRLDILFAQDVDKTPVDIVQNQQEDNESQNDNLDSNMNDTTENNEKDNDLNNENIDKASSDIETENEPQGENQTEAPANIHSEEDKIVTVNIPRGSLPSTIANILAQQGLIDDKNEFLSRAQELNLDKKLQAGEFEIKQNSSLDTIIKIIAKSN